MSKTILLVNHEADFLLMAKTLLSKYGYKVFTHQDNTDPFQIVDKVKPDLMLMPLLAKGELPKVISKELNNVKIIYLTQATLTKEEKMELINQKDNPVDVVSYPVSPKKLLFIIQKHLNKK